MMLNFAMQVDVKPYDDLTLPYGVPKSLKRWYEGKYIPHENDPGSPVVFIGGSYERHWSAKAARALVEFWQREWKWTIGTAITIVGLLIAYKKLG